MMQKQSRFRAGLGFDPLMPEVSSSTAGGEIAGDGAAPERHDPGPPPVQFRLKTLLAAMVAFCVVFALAGRLSGVGAAALIWFLTLVAAHMAATAVGTRISSHAPTRLRGETSGPLPMEPFDPQRDCAPTTRLGGNARLGLTPWIGTLVGAVVGCGVGTTLVSLHTGGRLSWPGLVLAAGSSLGIGAFLSFLAGSCAKVSSRAWREAARIGEPRR